MRRCLQPRRHNEGFIRTLNTGEESLAYGLAAVQSDPVDPAGPDCYRGGTKPCKSRVPRGFL